MHSNSRVFEDLKREIELIAPGIVYENVLLSKVSKWKIGGIARFVIVPRDEEQLILVTRYLIENSIEYVVVGATTNILFSDHGLNVVALHIGQNLSKICIDNGLALIQSGTWVPRLARLLANKSLTGAEHICGIPGTLGGLICMNGGSQRKGIADNLISVKALNFKGKIVEFNRDECEFAYRTSRFQKSNDLIISAVLSFRSGNKSVIRKDMLKILKDRREKFPQKFPNCGSVFVSNPEMYGEFGPPGLVIEKVGFKGVRINQIQVSPLHANFIINLGGGASADVLQMISDIRESVFNKTGYLLKSEVKYMSSLGKLHHADEDGLVDLEKRGRDEFH